MRILLVNYRYFISGGPEKYMFNLMQIMREHGHEVIPFSIHSNTVVTVHGLDWQRSKKRHPGSQADGIAGRPSAVRLFSAVPPV